MTLIRKLASALCLVLLSLNCSNSLGQDAIYANGNVVPVTGAPIVMDTSNTATVGTNTAPAGTTILSTGNLLSMTGWTGINYGNNSDVSQCCSGGPTAMMNVDTNTIRFSWGSSTASQTIAINNALFEATGVRINGYTATALVNNGGQNSGPLFGSVSVKNIAGGIIDTQTFDLSNMNNGGNFDKVSLTRYFNNPYQVSELGSITTSWTGQDDRFWAGYYGPRVRDSKLTLQYYVDVCSRNPASSPNCAGYNDLLTSINIVPHPTGTATQGNPLDNTFPIATALSNSGSGLALHGFKYGFTYNLGPGSTECTATNQDGSCSWWKTISPFASVKVDIRNSSNQSLFSQSYGFSGSNTGPQSMAYQYLFPDSTNTSLMGNFGFNASVQGTGSVYNMYSKLIVTPDPCTSNPYSSSKCSGFTEAIAKLSGTNTTDYATIGYTEPATVTASTMATTTTTTATTGTVVDPNTQVQQTQQQPQQQQQQTTQTQQVAQQAPPPGQVQAPPPGQVGPQPPAQNGNPQNSAVANNATATPQPAGSPATVSSSPTVTVNSMSIAMSTISKNQEQQQAIQTATIQAALDNASQASTKAQQEAVSFVSKLNDVNATNNASFVQSVNAVETKTETKTSNSGQATLATGVTSSTAQMQSVTQMASNNNVILSASLATSDKQQTNSMYSLSFSNVAKTSEVVNYNQNVVEVVNLNSLYNVQAVSTVQQTQPQISLLGPTTVAMLSTNSQQSFFNQSNVNNRQMTVDAPTLNGNFMTDRNDPLNGVIDKKLPIEPARVEAKADAVNKNVQPNELAGNTDVNKIALIPVGYNSYLNFALKDASFYTPKEIYRNQVNVDNSRVLRQLSSDRLHEQMMEQQYKGK